MPALPGPIRALADRHRRVAIDSNVLIYLLDDDARWAEVSALIVDAVAEGRLEGVIASVGVSEALVGAAVADDGALFELAAATIRDLGFAVVPLDGATAEEAAWIRGRTGMSLADAVHVACAIEAGATAFITNDRQIRSQPRLDVVRLGDLGSAEVHTAPGG